MLEAVALCALVAFVFSQAVQVVREREWTRERAALLDRIAGTELVRPVEAPPRRGRAYGTDEDEWLIEQERLKSARGE